MTLVVVRMPSELVALRSGTTRQMITRVVLDLGLEPSTQTAAERRINEVLHPCGCMWGAFALGCSIVLWIAGLAFAGLPSFAKGVTLAVLTLAFVALIKALGYIIEVRLLGGTVDRILALTTARHHPSHDSR